MAPQDPIKIIKPIAFWKTRSFWFGWFPAALTGLDVLAGELSSGSAGPVSKALAALLGAFTGWTPDEIESAMLAVAPIYALVVAHQRRGINQPYTADPAKEKAVVQAIEDGKSILEKGIAIGKAIKAGR